MQKSLTISRKGFYIYNLFVPTRGRFRCGLLKLSLIPIAVGSGNSVAYLHPVCEPQFKHLKHAPLRMVICPQLGHAGESPILFKYSVT